MRSRADMSRSVYVAQVSLLMAVASVLGYAEAVLLPSLPVPGFRLGLANLAVVLSFALLGSSGALLVSLGRVLIVGLATGTLLGPIGIMSVVAALTAWSAMALLSRLGRESFSVIGISVAGSAAHVLGQLAAASILVGALHPFALAPLSLAAALCAGIAIGYSAHLLLSRVPFMKVSYA